MDAASLHPYAGPNRVYSVVVGLHRYFCSFAGFADDLFYHDETVEDLGYFYFQEFGKEEGARPVKDDDRGVVLQFHLLYHGPDILAFLEIILRYLFRFRQDQFTTFFVEQQNFFFPYLVDFGAYDLADPFIVFFYKNVLLQIADAAGKGLFCSEDSAAAEIEVTRALLARGAIVSEKQE